MIITPCVDGAVFEIQSDEDFELFLKWLDESQNGSDESEEQES